MNYLYVGRDFWRSSGQPPAQSSFSCIRLLRTLSGQDLNIAKGEIPDLRWALVLVSDHWNCSLYIWKGISRKVIYLETFPNSFPLLSLQFPPSNTVFLASAPTLLEVKVELSCVETLASISILHHSVVTSFSTCIQRCVNSYQDLRPNHEVTESFPVSNT